MSHSCQHDGIDGQRHDGMCEVRGPDCDQLISHCCRECPCGSFQEAHPDDASVMARKIAAEYARLSVADGPGPD